MTRFALFLFFFVILAPKALSQPPLAWAGQVDFKNDLMYSQTGWYCTYSMDVDKTGAMYIAGMFSDTIDVDPSGKELYLNADNSNRSIHIIKISPAGKLVSVKTLTLGACFVTISTVKIDTLGSLYMAGYFGGVIDFDPGPATSSLNAKCDGFVMKLDASGNFMWVKQFKSYGGSFSLSELTIDKQLNLYISGQYGNGSVDMDPGANKFFLQSIGKYNVFVTKLDQNGSLIWAKAFNGVYNVTDIKCDKYGDVLFTGWTGSGAHLDPGTATVSPAYSGGYLCRLTGAGNFSQALFFEGSCNITSLIVSDRIFILGDVHGPADIDPGQGSYVISPTVGISSFFASLDSLGNFLWAKQLISATGSYTDQISSTDIQMDSNKNLYVISSFSGDFDFDPGPSTNIISGGISNSYGLNSIAFSSFDMQGNLLWAHAIPHWYEYYLPGKRAHITPEGDVYSASQFRGSFDFDPGPATYTMETKNRSALIIRKLSKCKNLPTISLNSDKIEICKGEEVWLTASGGESYSWNYNFQPVPVVITAPQTNMYYQVIGKDNLGCKSSAEIAVTVNECTSLNIIKNDAQLFYPNPTNDILYFTNSIHGQIRITNITGRLTKEITVTSDENSIDLSELPPGIYFLDYRDEMGEIVRAKIVRK